MKLLPFRLQPTFSERPWGRRDLRPWYSLEQTGTTAEPIGESWLTGPASVVASGPLEGRTLLSVAQMHGEALLGEWRDEGEFPLLLKLLFPDEKLSVQVHPDDAEARRMGQRRGKTECWYVVAAVPGAAVACGLLPEATPERIRKAVADGSMESLLRQVPVAAGDMVFVDAGTVHAIGPGVTLLETQQTSDVTFRMFDYGRPRELHLEQGIAVTKLHTGAGKVPPVQTSQGMRLIEQRYFTVDRFELRAGESVTLSDAEGKPHCVSTLAGTGFLGSGGESLDLLPATAAVVPADAGAITLTAAEPLVCIRSMP